jgi:putative oxidoreductase
MKANARYDIALLILRVGIGLIAMYYGSQKLFGVFGGQGIQGTIEGMKSHFGIPPIFAILAMCGEFFGGLGMLVGALTPVAAFGLACTMAVATFENWKTPGVASSLFENSKNAEHLYFTVVIFVATVAIMIMGAGSFSIDSRLFRGGKRGKG